MILGVDFDNTIVCYDRLFHKVAGERNLIPSNIDPTKSAVRNYLREIDREDAWTEIQGCVYGARMSEANPLPHVLDCLSQLIRHDVMVCIVSHKTKFPYLGPKYNLHESAWAWLTDQGFFDRSRVGLCRDVVYFEETKTAKLARIAGLGCTHFIDDLPEILTDPSFPSHTERILFDPSGAVEHSPLARASSWLDIPRMLSSEFGFNIA